MAEHVYKPGSKVVHSGVYLVSHQNHRPDHEATLVEGHSFPVCSHCGVKVRFKLLSPAHAIEKDHDFRKNRRAQSAG